MLWAGWLWKFISRCDWTRCEGGSEPGGPSVLQWAPSPIFQPVSEKMLCKSDTAGLLSFKLDLSRSLLVDCQSNSPSHTELWLRTQLGKWFIIYRNEGKNPTIPPKMILVHLNIQEKTNKLKPLEVWWALHHQHGKACTCTWFFLMGSSGLGGAITPTPSFTQLHPPPPVSRQGSVVWQWQRCLSPDL